MVNALLKGSFRLALKRYFVSVYFREALKHSVRAIL